MNKFVRISTSLLLSLFILVSGSGLIIGKMVCVKSGYVLISANEAEDCCLDEAMECCVAEEEGFSFNDQCCSINNLAFQQQQFLGQNQLLIKSSVTSSLILLPEFLTFSQENFHSTSNHFFFPDPPDLISGSSALPLLGVFRV